jgi:hypothetical protein
MIRKTTTLIQRIRRKLKRMDERVVLRDDFSRLGGYVQVGRALREMVDSQELVRLGYGLYAKTTQDDKEGRKAIGSFESLATEAFVRLGIKVEGYTKENCTELTVHLTQPVSRRISLNDKHTNYKIHHHKVDFSETLRQSKHKHKEANRKQQLNGDISTDDVSFLSSDTIKDAVVDLSRGFKR